MVNYNIKCEEDCIYHKYFSIKFMNFSNYEYNIEKIEKDIKEMDFNKDYIKKLKKFKKYAINYNKENE